jgi:hypothetical protein
MRNRGIVLESEPTQRKITVDSRTSFDKPLVHNVGGNGINFDTLEVELTQEIC